MSLDVNQRWSHGEPNNTNELDCVIMEAKGIKDISCTEHNKAFICQKRGEQVFKLGLLLDQVGVDFKL